MCVHKTDSWGIFPVRYRTSHKATLRKQHVGRLGAQSVKHSTLAQVMISRFVALSPVLGSVLTAQSLEPALDSVSPSLSALP